MYWGLNPEPTLFTHRATSQLFALETRSLSQSGQDVPERPCSDSWLCTGDPPASVFGALGHTPICQLALGVPNSQIYNLDRWRLEGDSPCRASQSLLHLEVPDAFRIWAREVAHLMVPVGEGMGLTRLRRSGSGMWIFSGEI